LALWSTSTEAAERPRVSPARPNSLGLNVVAADAGKAATTQRPDGLQL